MQENGMGLSAPPKPKLLATSLENGRIVSVVKMPSSL